MLSSLRQKAIVQPGGVIEIRSPELPAGAVVDVVVILEPEPRPSGRSLSSLIGSGKGSFATPEEAAEFIRRERDKWTS